MVGTAAGEYQLTGNVSLDDGFQAASSPNRLSRLDPVAASQVARFDATKQSSSKPVDDAAVGGVLRP